MDDEQIRAKYLPLMDRLGPSCSTKKGLHSDFLIHQGRIRVYFAPMKSTKELHVALKFARLLLVGLTPGMTQAKAAFEDYFAPHAEDTVSFKGPMRSGLCRYLDALGVPRALGIDSSQQLFGAGPEGRLATSTSLLRYPVFKRNGGNYGGTPPLTKEPFLREMAESLLLPLLRSVNDKTLIVPLGVAVSDGVRAILGDEVLQAPVLWGFPHPSGLNTHAPRLFKQVQLELTRKVASLRSCSNHRAW